MNKVLMIFLNALPLLLMIGLIPLLTNDYLLAVVDVVIVIIALCVKREKNDLTVFLFGFLIMIFSEYLFVSTGVETFNRHTLFGIMPLWLPLLWGYGFIGIKRGVEIIDKS